MLSLFNQMQKKRFLNRYLLFLGAVVLFHSVIYYPVYLFLASDVAWKSSILYFLWTEIAEPLSVYLFFWGSFAFLIYAGIREGNGRAAIPYLIVYAVGSVLRYALQNVCYIFMMGLASWKVYFSFWDILWNILLDLAIMGCVFALLLVFLKRMRREGDAREICLPVTGFFNLKNLLIRLSLSAAAFPSLARILPRAYYDIFGGNVPSGVAEIFLMITYYATDVLTALLGHIVIVMMISAFHVSDVRSRMRFDAENKK